MDVQPGCSALREVMSYKNENLYPRELILHFASSNSVVCRDLVLVMKNCVTRNLHQIGSVLLRPRPGAHVLC